MKRLAIVAVASVILIVMSACGQNESAKSTGSAQEKESYHQTVQAQLDELAKGIADLQAKAEEAGAEAKAKMQETIKQLEQKKETAQDKLEKSEAATAETWKNLKADIDTAMQDLKQAYDRAVAQLRR